jgi:hypothetical protein
VGMLGDDDDQPDYGNGEDEEDELRLVRDFNEDDIGGAGLDEEPALGGRRLIDQHLNSLREMLGGHVSQQQQQQQQHLQQLQQQQRPAAAVAAQQQQQQQQQQRLQQQRTQKQGQQTGPWRQSFHSPGGQLSRRSSASSVAAPVPLSRQSSSGALSVGSGFLDEINSIGSEDVGFRAHLGLQATWASQPVPPPADQHEQPPPQSQPLLPLPGALSSPHKQVSSSPYFPTPEMLQSPGAGSPAAPSPWAPHRMGGDLTSSEIAAKALSKRAAATATAFKEYARELEGRLGQATARAEALEMRVAALEAQRALLALTLAVCAPIALAAGLALALPQRLLPAEDDAALWALAALWVLALYAFLAAAARTLGALRGVSAAGAGAASGGSQSQRRQQQQQQQQKHHNLDGARQGAVLHVSRSGEGSGAGSSGAGASGSAQADRSGKANESTALAALRKRRTASKLSV